MAIIINGINNGIVCEGNLTLENATFEFGKGLKSAQVVEAEEAEIVPSTKEEAVRDAIQFVLALKDNTGEFVFKKKNQWFSIYRILVDFELYEKRKYTGFDTYIASLSVGQLINRIPVMARELSKYDDGLYAKPFSEWDITKAKNPTTYNKFESVARPFSEKLTELLPK